jgi:hypothetical protein
MRTYILLGDGSIRDELVLVVGRGHLSKTVSLCLCDTLVLLDVTSRSLETSLNSTQLGPIKQQVSQVAAVRNGETHLRSPTMISSSCSRVWAESEDVDLRPS